MTSPLLSCPGCNTPLGEGMLNLPDVAPCPTCRTPVQLEVFPALFRPVTRGQNAEPVMLEGESSCFYHPVNRAVVPCQGCGRFLCALCDCELNGEHFCPACLETGRTKGRIRNLENQRTLYDGIALALAVLPMLMFYFTLVTAPIALYVAIRYWKAPLSIVRRTKTRFVLAIILATLQLAGWAIGGYFIYRAIASNG